MTTITDPQLTRRISLFAARPWGRLVGAATAHALIEAAKRRLADRIGPPRILPGHWYL